MKIANTHKKVSSKIEDENCEICPMQDALAMIVGKWKTVVLWHLCDGTKRYGELKKEIPQVTEKMLIQTLRELESDKLVNRVTYTIIPPKVEYSLTDKGKALKKILSDINDWSLEWNN